MEAAQQGEGEGAGADASEEETSDAEPLILTLSAPEICEAQHPRSDGIGWAWGAEGTVQVNWTASGGGGAYTVTIAGEEYTGPSGSAEVTCALEHGRIRDDAYGRRYVLRNKPVVDSGLKTITATVTDGAGATADVYVILAVEDEGHVLQSGETYRIRGWLVTVPEGVEIDWHRGVEESVCVKTRSDGTIDESVDCQKHFYLGGAALAFTRGCLSAWRAAKRAVARSSSTISTLPTTRRWQLQPRCTGMLTASSANSRLQSGSRRSEGRTRSPSCLVRGWLCRRRRNDGSRRGCWGAPPSKSPPRMGSVTKLPLCCARSPRRPPSPLEADSPPA